jgi:hypothetical protein
MFFLVLPRTQGLGHVFDVCVISKFLEQEKWCEYWSETFVWLNFGFTTNGVVWAVSQSSLAHWVLHCPTLW